METVLTITLNPAIDVTTHVDVVHPDRKLRCRDSSRDPGGGGLNVARVIKELGGQVTAAWANGGETGKLLEELLAREALAHRPLPITEPIRENVTVMEAQSGAQYRFVLEGPRFSPREAELMLAFVQDYEPKPGFLVLSGSLPPGLPAAFYAELAERADKKRTRVVVDTSGDALSALRGKGVFMIKPNLGELSQLVGKELESERAIAEAARGLIRDGMAEVLLVSMGARGACVVSADEHLRIHAPPVRPVSRVGAGDSTVGGMVYGLSQGWDLGRAARYGVAAGSATVLSPGTRLCTRADTERLFAELAA